MSKKNKKKTAKKKRRIIILCAIVAVVLIVALLVTKRFKKPDFGENMTTQTASRMTIEKTIETDGEIVSALEENALPHTSYYLDEINIEKGDLVKEDEVILTYTNGYTMTAPYDCVVENWELPELEDQLTSDHYVKIAGVDVMQMEISVAEDEIADIEVGDSATVTVEATGTTYEAEVSYVSQVGSYSGGNSSFSATVTFDNDGKVKLGMSGTTVVSLDRAENVVAVPLGAVSTRNGKSYVSVVNGEEMSPTEVEVGISNDSFVEIKSGLNEGDNVLVMTSSDESSDFGGFGGFGGGMPKGMSPPSGGGSRDGNSRGGISGGSRPAMPN